MMVGSNIKMLKKCLAFLVLSLLNLNGLKSEIYDDYRSTRDYYIDLIQKEEWKSLNYELPTYNHEFELDDESQNETDIGSFDFVIVGAGSAGSVLAKRLSEVKNFKILLLEAGGYETNFSEIPAELYYQQFSKRNWGYKTTPQKNGCRGMVDFRCNVPRGKSIGGTSAINGLMAVRGNKWDYDRWAYSGVEGWTYKEVLPYFKKLENFNLQGDNGYHGKNGPLNVEYSEPSSEFSHIWFEANKELGTRMLDYNGALQIGVGRSQINTKNGRRQSTGRAFLDRANVENLVVSVNSLAIKILFDKSKTAKKVVFIKNGKKYIVKSKKEIILSAGAYNSPQLLMLSGIGPKNHLKELGINLVVDLPVGENLQEHFAFNGLNFRANSNIFKSFSLKEKVEQYLNGVGPLTKVTIHDVLGFATKHNGSRFAHLEYLPLDLKSPIFIRALNWNSEIIDTYINQLNTQTDFSISLALLHPRSLGKVTLKSKNPLEFPEIDYNMFSNENDLYDFRQGIRRVLKLLDTNTFKKLGVKFIDIPICARYEKFSDDYWNCALKHLTTTFYHPIRTTPMGNGDVAVVDGELKVHKTKSLRVVDAGVFPYTISGHTGVPTIMVAEKAADLIKKEYKKNQRKIHINNKFTH